MSEIHKMMADHGTCELKAFRDESVGLKGFIGFHDTTLGPAAGGTRRYAFESEEEAIRDILRLSRAMTYKYAISGVNMGGGKAVIWVDDDHCSEELYRAYGRIVDSFEGRFLTGGDVGTDARELRWINMETDYVAGMPEQFDHPESYYHGGGLGVKRAIEGAADFVYDGGRDLSDLHVAIQGVGDMGYATLRYLVEADAQVTVADIDDSTVDEVVDEFGVGSVDAESVYDVDCDVFAPSALGGVLNDDTIPRLKCDIVAGAANNQLEEEEKHAEMLHERDILYIPDYLANSGRTIDDTDLLRKGGYNHERARAMIDEIYDRVLTVATRSTEEDTPTQIVTNRIAEERLENVRNIRPRVYERRAPQWG